MNYVQISNSSVINSLSAFKSYIDSIMTTNGIINGYILNAICPNIELPNSGHYFTIYKNGDMKLVTAYISAGKTIYTLERHADGTWDSTWTKLISEPMDVISYTLSTSFTPSESAIGSGGRISKQGSMVTITGTFSSVELTANTEKLIGTLSVVKPVFDVNTIGTIGAGTVFGKTVRIKFATDGKVYVICNEGSGSSTVRFSVTFCTT